MKKIQLAVVLILASILVALFIGCNLMPVSIADRIDMFMEELNSNDWSGVYLHFSEEDTADYDSIKPAAFWEGLFDEADQPFAVSDIDKSDSDNVTLTIKDNSGALVYYVKFKMVEIGSKWYIEDMYTRLDPADPWNERVT
jgi:hypothetical protein